MHADERKTTYRSLRNDLLNPSVKVFLCGWCIFAQLFHRVRVEWENANQNELTVQIVTLVNATAATIMQQLKKKLTIANWRACIDGQSEEGRQKERKWPKWRRSEGKEAEKRKRTATWKAWPSETTGMDAIAHRVIESSSCMWLGTSSQYVSSIRRRDYNFVLINAKCRSQVRANTAKSRRTGNRR